MSFAPDQLLLKGKLLLPKTLQNASNNQTHQSHHGSPLPIYPNLAAEFLIPILPHLNLLFESAPSTAMGEAMGYPSTPMNLDKSKRKQDHEPREVINIIDERETEGIIQRKEIRNLKQLAEEPKEHFFSETAMPSQVTPSQPYEGLIDAAMPSEGSFQQPESGENGTREDQGIDLNKTPQQKPRKKKHRPKVVCEGKPCRTPKPVTPKPVTPKPARNKESPSGQRYYVRRKKAAKSLGSPSCPSSEIVNTDSELSPSGKRRYFRKKRDINSSDTPLCPSPEIVYPYSGTDPFTKRKYVRKKKVLNSFDTPSAPSSEIIDPDGRSGTKSVRRCLDFNSEELRPRDAHPSSSSSSATISRSSIESPAPAGQVPKVAVENSEAVKFNLKSLPNQSPNEYIRIPETPSPPSRPFRLTMAALHSLKGYIGAEKNPTAPPQNFRRELIRENPKELASKNDNLKISGNSDSDISLQNSRKSQLDSNSTPYVLLRRRKRDHMIISEDDASAYLSFMNFHKGIGHITENHCPYFPEIHKKKRTSRQKELHPNASSSSLISSPSTICKTSLTMPNNSEVFPSAVVRKPRTSRKTTAVVRKNCELLTIADRRWFMAFEKWQSSESCSYANNTRLEAHKALSVLPAQIALASGNSKHKYSHLRVGSIRECRSGRNFKKLANFRHKNLHPRGISLSSAIVPYGDPLYEIVRKMNRLTISGQHNILRFKVRNSLVPYDGAKTVVPYEGPFDFIKKRRPRPKVDLDPETDRVWKVLMGKESTDETTDMDKEKWWEEERRIVHGRVDSFIARMHLVQGDRRFSQWKGSVVDSVVGVFLTQNVSDHLSSSAFMALAARFPPKPTGNDGTQPNVEKNCSLTELCPRATPMEEKETTNSNGTLERVSGGSVLDHPNCIDGNERELELSQESLSNKEGVPVTETGSTSVSEAEDRRSTEQIRLSSLSNFDMEDFMTEGVSSVLDRSTSFIDLLQMTDNTKFQELYGHGNGMFPTTSLSNTFDRLKGKYLSMYEPYYQPPDTDQVITSVSCAPSTNSRLTTLEDVNSIKEESASHLLSTASRMKLLKDTQIMNEESSTEAPSLYSHLYSSYSRLTATISGTAVREECNSHLQFTASESNSANNKNTMNGGCGPSEETRTESFSCAPPLSSEIHDSPNSRLTGMGDLNAEREKISSDLPPIASGVKPISKNRTMGSGCGLSDQILGHKIHSFLSKTGHVLDTFSPITEQPVRPLTCSETEARTDLQKERTETSPGKLSPQTSSGLKENERGNEFQEKSTEHTVSAQAGMQNGMIHQTVFNSCLKETLKAETDEPNLKGKAYSSQTSTANSTSKRKKVKIEGKTYNWDNLRKQSCRSGPRRERSRDTMDSLDWEAVRRADVNEIAQAIRERGMNNRLAERIKDFLDRLVKEHGSIDLEWLRDVPPDDVKDYLLSIRGLGLKSVECVRLLTLHQLAFPVDTNVGRVCVRLGWVPLQPLPESLQLHLLELYPMLETIQKYLWPRLCKLDQRTLYELHYQMITFGKVFCTKSKPNCNACPMRAECRHFASAFASARLALPGPEEKGLVNSTIPVHSEPRQTPVLNPMPLPQLEGSTLPRGSLINNCEPIIEEPASPEPESIEALERDIEFAFYEDPDEIPTINLNLEEFTQNVQNYMEKNMELQDGDMSKALIAITQEAASIPMPKLKNVSRLRTEHQVYELPDTHPLLDGMDRREPDDPSSYLLAIWTPGETSQSTEPPKACCDSQDTGKLCDQKTCFACSSLREAQAQTVRGTILIPCRTAMRGGFPLNGTYFQVNEVFADHDSSCNPIDVPRKLIWNLPQRTVYFGTSIQTMFKGLTTEEIQHCFWRGFVCVRGFDRTTRASRPLYARLHFPASKALRNKRTVAATTEAAEATVATEASKA